MAAASDAPIHPALKDYTLQMVDADFYMTVLTYRYIHGKDYVSMISLDMNGYLLCQYSNYIFQEEDYEKFKNFLVILKDYLTTFFQVSFFRND
jgi:hypothetical protein